MDPIRTSARSDQRFQALYDCAYVDVLRFVRRRVHPSHAEDVVSDVFLVAWRRLDDVPADPSAARAWLFGVARKTMQNARRSEGRKDALAIRLANDTTSVLESDLPGLVAARVDISRAWPRLTPVQQEALCLVVLDGLAAGEAARVLGISPTAFRLRLSRARRALRHEIESNPSEDRTNRDLAPARRLQ